MVTASRAPEQCERSARAWATVLLLLAGATVCGALLDPYVSLTSQAMLYVLVVVIGAYRLDWQLSVLSRTRQLMACVPWLHSRS